MWLQTNNNTSIYNKIIIRNNFYVNVTFKKFGLLQGIKNEYINSEIIVENNYF